MKKVTIEEELYNYLKENGIDQSIDEAVNLFINNSKYIPEWKFTQIIGNTIRSKIGTIIAAIHEVNINSKAIDLLYTKKLYDIDKIISLFKEEAIDRFKSYIYDLGIRKDLTYTSMYILSIEPLIRKIFNENELGLSISRIYLINKFKKLVDEECINHNFDEKYKCATIENQGLKFIDELYCSTNFILRNIDDRINLNLWNIKINNVNENHLIDLLNEQHYYHLLKEKYNA